MRTIVKAMRKKLIIPLCLAVVFLFAAGYIVMKYQADNESVWQPADMFFREGVPYVLQDGTLYRHVQETPEVFLESEKEWEPVEGAEHIKQVFGSIDGEICYLREDGSVYLSEDIYPEEYLGNSGIVFEVARQMMKLNGEQSFSCIARYPIAESNTVISQDGALWYWNLEEAAFVKYDMNESELQGNPVYVTDYFLLTDAGKLYEEVRRDYASPMEYKCISEEENIVSITIGTGGYLAQTADGRTLSFRYVCKYPNDRSDRTMINDPLPVSEWRNVTPYYVDSALAIGINEKGKVMVAADEEHDWSEMQKAAFKELASWKNICYIIVYDGAYVGMQQDGELVSARFEEAKVAVENESSEFELDMVNACRDVPMVKAADYGLPDTKSSKMDELLLAFIDENVPEDAIWENASLLGNMAIGGRNSEFDDMPGYCFSYKENNVNKQMIILDYETDDSVYRADQLWLEVCNVPIIDAIAKMYVYEDKEWKYTKDIDPYLQKSSMAKDNWMLLVSGEQWENSSPRSRLLIAVEIDKTQPDNQGYGYFYYFAVQKRHHNVIWIGEYPIEFYWDEAFKVIFAAGCLGIVVKFILSLVKKYQKQKQIDT